MRPLLIVPPAPARWPALQDLPLHDDPLWWHDLEKRFAEGLRGAQDAFMVTPDGGRFLACAAISKRHDLGILSRIFTRPEHRHNGLARSVLDGLLTWFDMVGGKWLYVTAPTGLESLFGKFGFHTIRRAPRTPEDILVMLRPAAEVPEDPLTAASAPISVHDVTRANWPSIVTLLYNRAGPDPRVPLDESAAAAEVTALELLSRQETETCHLKAAFSGPRLIGLATVATDRLGDRTYAMVMPHRGAPPELREAIIAFARSKGYEHVDFPMEALATPEPQEAVAVAPREAVAAAPQEIAAAALPEAATANSQEAAAPPLSETAVPNAPAEPEVSSAEGSDHPPRESVTPSASGPPEAPITPDAQPPEAEPALNAPQADEEPVAAPDRQPLSGYSDT